MEFTIFLVQIATVDFSTDLIANHTEEFQFGFFASFKGSRVVEGPMQALPMPGKIGQRSSALLHTVIR